MNLKIASWNINSIRIRLNLIKRFIEQENIDILALQETKVENSLFPINDLRLLGFDHIYFNGEKSYNGVAILSKYPLSNIKMDIFGGEDQTRHISGTINNDIIFHNFYVPAGGDDPDINVNPKFKHKLDYVDDMLLYFRKNHNINEKIIIVGDFNIAPQIHDVWSHKQLQNVVSHTEPEIFRLNNLLKDFNWVDSARLFIPIDKKAYSWWSYRNKDWKKSNRGRRLDHIWCTQKLKNCLKSYKSFNEARDWEKPSDHVPIITEFIL